MAEVTVPHLTQEVLGGPGGVSVLERADVPGGPRASVDPSWVIALALPLLERSIVAGVEKVSPDDLHYRLADREAISDPPRCHTLLQ